ncbi:hypothetical protein ABIA72_002228 [Stenotrophomonas rhizophila]
MRRHSAKAWLCMLAGRAAPALGEMAAAGGGAAQVVMWRAL